MERGNEAATAGAAAAVGAFGGTTSTQRDPEPKGWTGTATAVNPDGSTTTITRNPGGSRTITDRDSDGNVTQTRKIGTGWGGTTEIITTDADGNVKEQVVGPTGIRLQNPDGTWTQIDRDDSGTTVTSSGTGDTMTREDVDYGDGSTSRATRTAEGGWREEWTEDDGRSGVVVTDADGNKIASSGVDHRGTRYDGHRTDNGGWSENWTGADGSTGTTVRGPDGQLEEYSAVDRDGDRWTGKGTPDGGTSYTEQRENGDWGEYEYYPDGSRKEVTWRRGNLVSRVAYDPDGNVVDYNPDLFDTGR